MDTMLIFFRKPLRAARAGLKPALIALLGLAGGVTHAELKPQWELGAGVGGVSFPWYRGATEYKSYVLPVPYGQYRGEILQVDRDRMRGMLFRHDKVELDVSLGGSLPVKSSDVAARAGMPDLDATLEMGPEARIHLYYDERRYTNLDLRLPVRAVYAVNWTRFEHQGWLFHPRLSLSLRNVAQSPWSMSMSAALLYGDQGYNAYFYDVAPQYASSARAAYASTGGYAGNQFMWGVGRRLGDTRLGAFVKWDDLNGAVFADSPLVTRKQQFTVGFVVAWVFWKSDKMVEVSDD
jgi:outer membrane scaffolding protein for murein synthesis (MipA/OmpV family)